MFHCILCYTMLMLFKVISSNVKAKINLVEIGLCLERYILVYHMYILETAALTNEQRKRHPSSQSPSEKRFGSINSSLKQQQ